MSTIVPVLIAAALLVSLIVSLFCIYRYIHRHQQPDRARLRVLRGGLWFLAGWAVLYALAEVICLVRGEHSSATDHVMLPWITYIIGIASISLQIKKIQKRLKNHDN
jgi:hypothetical protein